MASPKEIYIPTQAAEYFREQETLLRDLYALLGMIAQAMRELAAEYRIRFPKCRLVLDPNCRRPDLLPRAVYWVVLCQAGRKVLETRIGAGLAKLKGLKIHVPRKRFDHDLIYRVAKEAGRETLIMDFDRRAQSLNATARRVGNALMSIESILLARGERRSWEAGDLQVDAPEIASDLRGRSRNALGAAWLFLLRTTAVEHELISLADRYNEDPVCDRLRLSFERDAHHPYGRISWMHPYGRLARLGGPERACEQLTDTVMRQMRIQESVRRQLSRHEGHRRMMTRLHQRYTEVLGRLKRIGRSALASADASLLEARRRQATAG